MWAGILLTCLCWLLAASAASQSGRTLTENSSRTASLRRNRPFCDGCGVSNVSVARVVGGRPASFGEYPWMAYLNLTIGFCGGTLIDRQHVLTAAHCLVGVRPSQTTVLLGTTNKIKRPPGSLAIKAKKFFIHRRFNTTSFSANDIALVKLPSPITFTERIKPLCIGFNKDIPFGGRAVATGWGDRRFGASQSPNKLQEVTLDVLSKQDCRNIAGADPRIFICTLTRKKNVCQGDSGGPLIVRLRSRQWAQVGIVSYGFQCANRTPDVYTRVSQYLGWITARIRGGRC